MLLKEVERLAVVAWSPATNKDFLLATGCVAGTLDATFEASSELEIFSLQLQDDSTLEPVQCARVPFSAKFHRLSWGSAIPDNEETPLGLLLCGLDSGCVEIYNPHTLIKPKTGKDPLVWRREVSSSGIRGLEFNPKQPSQFLTAAGAGDVQVWDVNALQAPVDQIRTSKITDVSYAIWNPHAADLAAVSGKNGATVLLDTKRHREIVDLRHPQGAFAPVTMAWHPDDQMYFVTGYDVDSSPTNLCYWDLRKHNVPVLQWNAHLGGVECLAWCPRDPELLLTSGHDGRTLCWNPERAELLAELPSPHSTSTHSSTFEIQWSPRDPALFTTSSFDGRLRVYSIYGANPSGNDIKDTNNIDPFSKIAQQHQQQDTFSLNKAPRWLQTRHSAKFGIQNQLVSFVGVTGAPQRHLTIHQILADPIFAEKAKHLESCLSNGEDSLASYCDQKIQESNDPFDSLVWKFLRALLESDARRLFVINLGLTREELLDRMQVIDSEESDEVNTNGHAPSRAGSLNFSQSLLSNGGDQSPLFEIFSRSDSQVDRLLTRAVVIGDYNTAVQICMKADRMTDALMLSSCSGDPELISQTQSMYFSNRQSHFSRILHSVQTQELGLFVQQANLDDWKDILAMVCSSSKLEEYANLCDTLGNRLEQNQQVDNALLCYLCSGNVGLAIKSMHQVIYDGMQSKLNEVNHDKLFSFIEKVMVLLKVTKMQVDDCVLNDALAKYAELLLSHGMKQNAMYYLSLIDQNVSEWNTDALMLLKHRIGMMDAPFNVVYVPTEDEIVEIQRQQLYQQEADYTRQQEAFEYQKQQEAAAEYSRQQEAASAEYNRQQKEAAAAADYQRQQEQQQRSYGYPQQQPQQGFVAPPVYPPQQQPPAAPVTTNRVVSNYHDPPFVPPKPRTPIVDPTIAMQRLSMQPTAAPIPSVPPFPGVATTHTAVPPRAMDHNAPLPPAFPTKVPPPPFTSGYSAAPAAVNEVKPTPPAAVPTVEKLDGNAQYVLATFGKILQDAKQRAGQQYQRPLEDCEKKIQGLRDGYGSGKVNADVAGRLVHTAQALDARDYLTATHAIAESIAMHYADWWIGIKRLVDIVRTLP